MNTTFGLVLKELPGTSGAWSILAEAVAQAPRASAKLVSFTMSLSIGKDPVEIA